MRAISSTPARSVAGSESSVPNEQKEQQRTWGKGSWMTPFGTNPTNQKPIFSGFWSQTALWSERNGANRKVGRCKYKGLWGRWDRREEGVWMTMWEEKRETVQCYARGMMESTKEQHSGFNTVASMISMSTSTSVSTTLEQHFFGICCPVS